MGAFFHFLLDIHDSDSDSDSVHHLVPFVEDPTYRDSFEAAEAAYVGFDFAKKSCCFEGFCDKKSA